jgi:hypothetical protein
VLEVLGQLVGKGDEAAQGGRIEALPHGGDRALPPAPQLRQDAASLGREPVDALTRVARADRGRDETAVQQRAQPARHRCGRAVASAREERRHERLVRDLLEQPPLGGGEVGLGGQLAAAQGEDVGETLEGGDRFSEPISQAACRVAENAGAAAILAFTQTGGTAAMVAKYRPALPIYAVTPSQAVRRRLALYAGVRSLRVDIEGDTEAQIRSVEEAVLEATDLKKGDVVVITMGSPVSAPGTTNLMKVHRLGTGDFYEVY